MEKGASFDLYRDIAERTDGDIYVGVVGPVRTGKSTLITRFMEELVLPEIEGGPEKARIEDELPQAGSGRTIMTTQPKFVPGEAVSIMLGDHVPVRIRMVDSVGYLVRGALGSADADGMRMVHTPWFPEPVPFEMAAEAGTRKVMTDHATIGLVVTTDGSIADLPRSAYVEAEERVVNELKALGKPFVVVLNSASPRSAEALSLRDRLEDHYGVPVMLLNVQEMQVSDIQRVLETVLMEFPLQEIRLNVPDWLRALDGDHWLVQHVLEGLRSASARAHVMRESDVLDAAFGESPYAAGVSLNSSQPGEGRMTFDLQLKEGLFNRVLSEECGAEIRGDAHLLSLMKELICAKAEYDRIAGALAQVKSSGYGIVTPAARDAALEGPELVKQGNLTGVRLRATAPAIHMIRVDVASEMTPMVGTGQQAEDMAGQMRAQMASDAEGIWDMTFFGKSIENMVQESLNGKLMQMPEDARGKVQETLTRIVNEGEGGMICILL